MRRTVVGPGKAVVQAQNKYVHRNLDVPWACMKVARMVDRRTFSRETAG